MIKCISLLFILRSLKASSVLGDVFILKCTVSRVKSKRCHGKVNSIVDFQASPLSHAQLFNWNQSFLVSVLDYVLVLLNKGNGGSGNEIGPFQTLHVPNLMQMSENNRFSHAH